MSNLRIEGGTGGQTFGTIDTSFKTIYNDLIRFRKVKNNTTSSANHSADELFGALDQPGHYYFKLFFYFSNPYSSSSNPLASNLLGTSYEEETASEEEGPKTMYGKNTALNYLYNNREYTRFNYLAEFIQLLSDISTKSPWYFQQISGIDSALERNPGQRDFSVSEERKSITIKCLPDAYDNRVGRLLDLYRAVVWSSNLHKWILPRNLRKFDMGIYIFNSPIKTMAGGRFGISGSVSDRMLETTFKQYSGESSDYSDEYTTQMYKEPVNFTGYGNGSVGCKYIELRGCEIDYNSSKSAYSELDNAEGKEMEYEIVIKYDSAKEDRYDPIFNDFIGDFVKEDISNSLSELREESPYDYMDQSGGIVKDVFGGLESYVKNSVTVKNGELGKFYGTPENPLTEGYSNLLGSAANYVENQVMPRLNSIMMGNIYGFSLGRIGDIVNGDPVGAIISTGKEINNASLIMKRIEDFKNPDKGLKELSGKSLYNGWTETTKPSIKNKKLPDYPGEPEILSDELPKKLPDYPGEPEIPSDELPKKLPDYPVEPEITSGELPKKLPEYPVEPEITSGELPKKLPGYPE